MLVLHQVTKKARLTKVVFNPKYPILLVGDSKGNVAALKLSPNLRRCCVADKPGVKQVDLERAKLDEVVEVARKSQAAGAAEEEAAAVAAAAKGGSGATLTV